MKKYYPGEPVNIYIQSLIIIIQNNNWLITTKKGKGELPLFFGDGERFIPIYALSGGDDIPQERGSLCIILTVDLSLVKHYPPEVFPIHTFL